MALSPSDVNAPHFWRLLNLGVYQGQENDLSKLCGKLKVRASRLNQSIHVNFEEHCVLIGAFGIWVGHGRAVMLGCSVQLVCIKFIRFQTCFCYV